jgi:NAD(P)-dependent dehydrogenase (short-subunit alcohol dehydrogenase family)
MVSVRDCGSSIGVDRSNGFGLQVDHRSNDAPGGAIHQMTLSLADALADRGITVNMLNPGPTDTG